MDVSGIDSQTLRRLSFGADSMRGGSAPNSITLRVSLLYCGHGVVDSGAPDRAKLVHASIIAFERASALVPDPKNAAANFSLYVPKTKPSSSAWQEPSTPPRK